MRCVPMPYLERFHGYSAQNTANNRRGWITGRQARQLTRMDQRDSSRRRGELVWTEPPPAKYARGNAARLAGAARTPARGSIATHVVLVQPGQKARHGKRIEREDYRP